MDGDRWSDNASRGGEARAGGLTALWWGLLLVVGGALWLADMTELVNVSPVVVAIVFGAGGIGFAIEFVQGTWWAAVPAGALLGLAALLALTGLTTAPGAWGASLLIASTGLGFVAVYARDRERRWALLVGGLLAFVATIVAVVPLVDRQESIPVVVLTIIAILLVVTAVVPIRGRPLLWPLIPAAVVAVVAWFLANGRARELEPYNWVLPAVLVVVGLTMLLRMLTGRTGRRDAGRPSETNR